MSNSLWPHGLQHTRLPCPSSTPGACSNSCPLSQWCHPTISPLSSPSPPTFNLSQHQGLKWVGSLHQVAKVLEFQHQSFQWIFPGRVRHLSAQSNPWWTKYAIACTNTTWVPHFPSLPAPDGQREILSRITWTCLMKAALLPFPTLLWP